jgi:hypothetical protein
MTPQLAICKTTIPGSIGSKTTSVWMSLLVTD